MAFPSQQHRFSRLNPNADAWHLRRPKRGSPEGVEVNQPGD